MKLRLRGLLKKDGHSPSAIVLCLPRVLTGLLIAFLASCSFLPKLLPSIPATSNTAAVPLDLVSISPNPISYPIAQDLSLTAVGSGFTKTSQMVFNGTQLATLLNRDMTLSATLPTSLVTNPGLFSAYVWDSSNHGNVSNSLQVKAQALATFSLQTVPDSITLNQWTGGQSTITVVGSNGFAGTVNLSAAGLPSGISAAFSPATNGVSVLTLSATGDVQPGEFNVRVTGVASNLSSTAKILLTAEKAPVPRDENAYCDTNGNWTGPRFDGLAELPRVCVHTDLADTPSPGAKTVVVAGADPMAALTAANCGDTILLQAGASFLFQGTRLPAKGCDDQHWITVRTSAPDAALPQEHARVNPSYAGVKFLPGRPPFAGGSGDVMAKLVLTNNKPLTPGDHYRFVGLEITRPSDGKWHNALLNPQTPYVIFDRCWIHGDPVAETGHLVLFSSGTDDLAVLDSYLTDAHCTAVSGACSDAQDLTGLGGGTAIKVVNNFLEASGENILLGGGAATEGNADIEVRLNHFFKPLLWMKGQDGFIGGSGGDPFIVKNLFELKNAQRVLLEGNEMEYSWGGFSQVGFGILLTPKNPGANTPCTICEVTDVTIRYDLVRHVAAGMQIANGLSDYGGIPLDGERDSIHDVIFDDIDGVKYNGPGEFVQVSMGLGTPVLQNITIDHVTAFPPSTLFVIGDETGDPVTPDPQMRNFAFTNSIVNAGFYPVWSTGSDGKANCAVHDSPLTTLNACFNGYQFAGNAIVASPNFGASTWPPENLFPATAAALDFINDNGGNGGDYRLAPNSPYKGTALDGKDPGADVDAVMTPVDWVQ